jgi:hypothetical protein
MSIHIQITKSVNIGKKTVTLCDQWEPRESTGRDRNQGNFGEVSVTRDMTIEAGCVRGKFPPTSPPLQGGSERLQRVTSQYVNVQLASSLHCTFPLHTATLRSTWNFRALLYRPGTSRVRLRICNLHIDFEKHVAALQRVRANPAAPPLESALLNSFARCPTQSHV